MRAGNDNGDWGHHPPPSSPLATVRIAEATERVAARVSRLSVSQRDPEAFFLARSELTAELRAITRRHCGPDGGRA
jgi:hypothetical protein